MVRETGKLPLILARRRRCTACIERLELKIERLVAKKSNKRLRAATEALRQKRDELSKLTEEVRSEYATWTTAENDCAANYFVLFRKHRPCNVAKQVVNTAKGDIEIDAAPLYSDVRWASLRPRWTRIKRLMSLLSKAAYYSTLTCYIFPVVLISSFLELTSLVARFPFLEGTLAAIGETGTSALTAFLPTLTMLLFFALLPMLCSTIAGMQGYFSFGHQSRDAFHRLFLFHFCWAFIGVTLGTTGIELLQNLQRLADDPAEVFGTIGDQLATMPSHRNFWGTPITLSLL